MSLRKTYKTDKNAENDGVELEVGVNDHNELPITIRITRMSRSNKKYAAALERATKPHSAAIQNETLAEALAQKMMQNVFVDTVLLGWGNLPKSELTGNDDDTGLLEYTKDNALALFKEMPDLYDDWEKRAKAASNFREAEKEISAGN